MSTQLPATPELYEHTTGEPGTALLASATVPPSGRHGGYSGT